MEIKILDLAHYGKKVRLYRNWHHPTEGKFSVQGRDFDGKQRVLGYVDRALMRDVTFYVSQDARARALAKGKNGQRSVHAWATGYLLGQDFDIDLLPQPLVEIRYNYKLHDSFVEKESGRAIYRAEYFIVGDRALVTIDKIIQDFQPLQLSLFG